LGEDVRARWLRQQLELGGAEVVLPEMAVVQAMAAARPTTAAAGDPAAAAPARPMEQPVAPAVQVVEEPDARPGADGPVPAADEEAGVARTKAAQDGGKGGKHWSVGAPPIPGPGLAIETESTLLEDEFRTLRTLAQVAERVAGCPRCGLAATRTRTVPGEGDPEARLMLVGEGPGANEDATGRPFVGAAGQLLDKILEAIEMPRETVFIANIVKCRPPQNRKPLPDEMAACLPYLRRQIALVKPAVLVALGGTAAEGLLGVKKGLGELRNKVHTYNGVPLIVTYHPAALLRNPNWKKPTWDDIRIARQLLDR
jgi:DNA polymerase